MPEEVDYTDKYNTLIPTKQLPAFNAWVTAQKKAGRDPLRDKFDYDVQGDWLAGTKKDPRGHGSDKFKKPNHPTFSDESQYHGVDGNFGGHWDINNNTYMPTETNLKFHPLPELQQYFKKTEPGTKLLPLQESIWDKAARAIVETQAQSRFTRTPINIKNIDLNLTNPQDALELPTEGSYIPNSNQINIGLYGTHPTYRDLQNVIHHEDIHALLMKAGIIKPDLLQHAPGQPDIRQKAFDSLKLGGRSGNPLIEAPAYMGAFNPNDTPNFTPQDRQAWLEQFKTTLPDKVADMYQRIINNFQTSQQPLPVQAPPLR